MFTNRLKTLCLEIYKTINCQNPTYMNEIFKKSCNRTSSRFPNNLQAPRVNQTTYGTRSICVLGPNIWNATLEELKNSASLTMFKRNLKLWDGPTCACKFVNIPIISFIYHLLVMSIDLLCVYCYLSICCVY